MPTPEQAPAPQAPRRQYVNFAFYKVDPAWRRLPESERTKGKQAHPHDAWKKKSRSVHTSLLPRYDGASELHGSTGMLK